MRRVLSKYGAYTNHLAVLSEDSSVKATDRSKLRGHYRKWVDAKYIFGCAVFSDLLAPCSVLSKAMQSDDLDILGAISSVVKSVRDTNKLSSTPLEKWPTYDYLIKNTSVDDEGQESYQSQELKNYSQAKAHYAALYQEYCVKVVECIKSRLAWSDLDLLRDIIFVLATQGWEKIVEAGEPLEAIDRLVLRFGVPLRKANVQAAEVTSEF